MGQYIIEGGKKLDGSIRVQGSKNSALPILAAAVAVGARCEIRNCPDITDVNSTLKIIKNLGCGVRRDGSTVYVDSSRITSNVISESLMHEMRSSIIFMGALISRTGEAEITAPGGCNIGLRPFNLHIQSMERLGVNVCEKYGKIRCTCSRVKGEKISLGFPSVGATENIILASLRASGITTIINAAREPEIVDLAVFLNSCGARIRGAGGSVITIEGVESLHSVQYTVMPDRIVACTYLTAAAVTGSKIILDDVIPQHFAAVISCFEHAGCRIDTANRQLRIISPERLKAFGDIRTMPYPGFPTDCQALIMAAAATADGETFFNETIFENRLRHVAELQKMGADIKVCDCVAAVNGVKTLQGAAVDSTDLRAGAALVVAGLCAEGTTTVRNIHYIDRGYDNLCGNLTALGAKIKKEG